MHTLFDDILNYAKGIIQSVESKPKFRVSDWWKTTDDFEQIILVKDTRWYRLATPQEIKKNK